MAGTAPASVGPGFVFLKDHWWRMLCYSFCSPGLTSAHGAQTEPGWSGRTNSPQSQLGWWKAGAGAPGGAPGDAEALEGKDPPTRGKSSAKTAVVRAETGSTGGKPLTLPESSLIKIISILIG